MYRRIPHSQRVIVFAAVLVLLSQVEMRMPVTVGCLAAVEKKQNDEC